MAVMTIDDLVERCFGQSTTVLLDGTNLVKFLRLPADNLATPVADENKHLEQHFRLIQVQTNVVLLKQTVDRRAIGSLNVLDYQLSDKMAALATETVVEPQN